MATGDRFIAASSDVLNGVNANNGGGYKADTFTGNFSDLHDGVGGPVATIAAATASSDGGGGTLFTKTGEITSAIKVGTYVYNSDGGGRWSPVKAVNVPDSFSVEESFTSGYTADVTVGGFFATPVTATDESLIDAGDQIWLISGSSFTLAANWTVPDGTATAPIGVITVDSNGDEVYVARVGTAELATTTMAEIDCGANRINGGDYSFYQSLAIITSGNVPALYGQPRVFIDNCSIKSTYLTVAATLWIDDYSGIVDSDIVSLATSGTDQVIYGNGAASQNLFNFTGNLVKVANSTSTLMYFSRGAGIVNNIFSGGAIGLRWLSSDVDYSLFKNNSFYNCTTCLQSDDTTQGMAPHEIIGNIVEGATTFYTSAATTGQEHINARNNILNGVAVAERYKTAGATLVGRIGTNDIASVSAGTSNYTDAANGDFTLASGADAIGAGLWGNDCGAVQSEGTGGGGCGNVGRGFSRGLI